MIILNIKWTLYAASLTVLGMRLCSTSQMDYLSAAFNFKNSGHWYIDADLKHKEAYTDGKYCGPDLFKVS